MVNSHHYRHSSVLPLNIVRSIQLMFCAVLEKQNCMIRIAPHRISTPLKLTPKSLHAQTIMRARGNEARLRFRMFPYCHLTGKNDRKSEPQTLNPENPINPKALDALDSGFLKCFSQSQQ